MSWCALACTRAGRVNVALIVPIVAYSFAWVGHFYFEKNKPASFIYPTFSLISDFLSTTAAACVVCCFPVVCLLACPRLVRAYLSASLPSAKRLCSTADFAWLLRSVLPSDGRCRARNLVVNAVSD